VRVGDPARARATGTTRPRNDIDGGAPDFREVLPSLRRIRDAVTTKMNRTVLWVPIAVVFAACDSGSDCVAGPCDSTGANGPAPVIAGFPSARAFAGVGRLAPGDSITLYAIRVASPQDPCVGADTLRSNVRWGVSNPAAATVTPLSDGGVRVRAVAAGNFEMLMREGESGAPSAALDAKIVFTCPAGLTISSIGVSP